MSASPLHPRTSPTQHQQESAPRIDSNATRPLAPRAAVVGGLLWMVAGPMLLFTSTAALILKADGFWTASDGFYAAGLAAMFAGRWLEFRSGAAETANGELASRRDLYRYSLLLGLSGLLIWLTASAIRTLWLKH